jgi:hypothetical protein
MADDLLVGQEQGVCQRFPMLYFFSKTSLKQWFMDSFGVI